MKVNWYFCESDSFFGLFSLFYFSSFSFSRNFLFLSLLSFIFSLMQFIHIKISIESSCISWVTLLCIKDMHSKCSSWDRKWPFWISFQSIKNSRYASDVHCFIKFESHVFKNEVTTYLHCRITAVKNGLKNVNWRNIYDCTILKIHYSSHSKAINMF